jgi:hypothetical protein
METYRCKSNSIFKFFVLGLIVLGVGMPLSAAPLSSSERVEWCKGQASASWVYAVVQLERYQRIEDLEFVKKVALTDIGAMKNLSRVARFSAMSYVQNFEPVHAIALDKYFNDAEEKGVSRSELSKTMKSDVARLMSQKYESCITELASTFELPR